MKSSILDKRWATYTGGTLSSPVEDCALIGTLELPDEALLAEKQMQDQSEIPMKFDTIEEAARRSILMRAQRCPLGWEQARFDLHSVFRELGATGRGAEELLSTTSLHQALTALLKSFRASHGRTNVMGAAFTVDDAAAEEAAAELIKRIVGGENAVDKAEGPTPLAMGLDYWRFENWVMPPRKVDELRRVISELLESGFIGLTVQELFDQIKLGAGDSNNSQTCAGNADIMAQKQDRVGKQQLKKGLGTLSVHLSETEAGIIMAAAGCGSGASSTEREGARNNDSHREIGDLLSFEKFSAFVNLADPKGQRQRQGSTSHPSPTNLNPAERGEETINIARPGDKSIAVTEEDSPVSPDSLTAALTNICVRVPTQSEDAKAAQVNGPETGSSSAAAHVEAFGRVAADVQAELASAIPSISLADEGNDNGGGGGKLREQGNTFLLSGSGGVASVSARGLEAEEADQNGNETCPDFCARSSCSSRLGPVPRTRAITPPLGPARSPSTLWHPTRASRERLKAALETLDLKERLKPTVGESKTARNDRNLDRESTASKRNQGEKSLPQKQVYAQDDHIWRDEHEGTGGGVDFGEAVSTVLPLGTAKGGRGGIMLRSTTVQAMGSHEICSTSGRTAGKVQSRRKRFQYPDEGNDSAAGDKSGHKYDSQGAAETIGRLRARVTELELSEQLLRCELEGARADLADQGKQAAAAASFATEKAKDRERVLQVRMKAQLRAAEAEVTSISKKMVDQKRSAAADSSARERSSLEYLRRRLKEAEVAFEAKAARRVLANKEASASRPKALAASGAEYATGKDHISGAKNSWAQGDGSRRFGVFHGNGGETKNLREELDVCRRKLVVVTAEASRLRKRVTVEEKNLDKGAYSLDEKEESRAWNKNCRQSAIMATARAMQEARRERRLAARLARSEDAQIEVEAEASRLQAFIDEMRGLGLPMHTVGRPQTREICDHRVFDVGVERSCEGLP